jgi:hypothetical protein
VKNIDIRISVIHGSGLYATKRYEPDDTIGFIRGKKEIVRKFSGALIKKSENWIGISRFTWINTEKSPFKFINHSCSPNVYIYGKTTVKAIRAINPDDELTMDYSFTEADTGWGIRSCACGSKNCRKKIGPVQSLKLSIFKKNIKYIPTNFKNIYTLYRKQCEQYHFKKQE